MISSKRSFIRQISDLTFSVKYKNLIIVIIIIILIGKPTGKGPTVRPRRRWEDCIRMDFKEIGINTRNWVDSAQDRNY